MIDAEKRMARLQARIDYLEGLSVTDELTGLLNRRGFAAQLDRALAAGRRTGQGGAMLIADLDGFKEVNDRFGHAAGDDLLRQVARLLSERVRRTDAVARLGGDEFAILLVGATEKGTENKAALLKSLIADTPFVVGAEQVKVAVSIGFAFYGNGETEDELFRQADMAMYAAKRQHKLARRTHLRPVAA
jgi:diguanylate cyclase (GGDEF)-like protein